MGLDLPARSRRRFRRVAAGGDWPRGCCYFNGDLDPLPTRPEAKTFGVMFDD
jgi:hypothetical protein